MLKLLNQLSNFFYWGWKLRENYDWDYSFLYEIIYLKLERMERIFRNKSYAINSKKHAKQIMVAKNLAKRLMDENYDFYETDFYKKWGGHEIKIENGLIEFIYPNVSDYNKNQRIAIMRDNSKKSEDKKALFDLLEKQIEYWWD